MRPDTPFDRLRANGMLDLKVHTASVPPSTGSVTPLI